MAKIFDLKKLTLFLQANLKRGLVEIAAGNGYFNEVLTLFQQVLTGGRRHGSALKRFGLVCDFSDLLGKSAIQFVI
ncbi:MAG: hypothetical protein KGS48_08095 [Bacteroidetes bacterium]|nr:hypothetical protein [Bacteroidota bacterium]